MFVVGGAVSLLTFKNWAGLSSNNPIGIFVVTYIVNAIFLFIYVVSQIILVVGTLEDRWPIGDISFGIFFFVIGQVILYVFSDTICDQVQHYLDGLFFATICNLLAVMMVYKVSDPLNCDRLSSAKWLINSTGIPSPVKISSFLSVSSNTTGKSRNSYLRTTNAAQFIKSRNMRPRCTSNPIMDANRTTLPLVTDFLLSRLHAILHVTLFLNIYITA
jgi:hypothetical protein